MTDILQHRDILKSDFATLSAAGPSDEQKGVPYPPLEKPLPEGAVTIDLPAPDPAVVTKRDVHACLADRRSRRKFAPQPLTLEQLSYLLWATQGLRRVVGDGYASTRTVPSAGARHPLETYLVVFRVEGLAEGIYRYLPMSHKLARVEVPAGEAPLAARVTAGALGQDFVARGGAVFVWACVPYRAEWRYGAAAHKSALLDAGHVAQNLYTACEALGLGTCAIGAYDQRAFDALLALDGSDEFTVYLAPVGRLREKGGKE